MTLKSIAEELTLIAQDIGGEVIRGPVRYSTHHARFHVRAADAVDPSSTSSRRWCAGTGRVKTCSSCEGRGGFSEYVPFPASLKPTGEDRFHPCGSRGGKGFVPASRVI